MLIIANLFGRMSRTNFARWGKSASSSRRNSQQREGIWRDFLFGVRVDYWLSCVNGRWHHMTQVHFSPGNILLLINHQMDNNLRRKIIYSQKEFFGFVVVVCVSYYWIIIIPGNWLRRKCLMTWTILFSVGSQHLPHDSGVTDMPKGSSSLLKSRLMN